MHRTILITGISTGIGKSFVEKASVAYPKDIIIAFTRNRLGYKLPSNVYVYYLDITDRTRLSATYKQAVKAHGSINILINNAGNGIVGTIEDTAIDEAKKQLELNVWSAIALTKLVLPSMRAARSGHIINISSMAATIDYPTMAYYGASKAMLEKLSRILMIEVEQWGIKVSIIAPGAVKTKFGKNMSQITGLSTSAYQDLYAAWSKKLASMFTKPESSDTVADEIIRIIERPKEKSFIVGRDRGYSILQRLVTNNYFNKHLLRKYMRNR